MVIVGRCGNCGGQVGIPSVWLGVNPPRPQCLSCGAFAKAQDKPTIEMERPQFPHRWYDGHSCDDQTYSGPYGVGGPGPYC